jgi:nucleolar protein 4
VSKADLEKRTQLEKYKRSMLKNLNMFVSPNRLCIRNIPPNIDDKKLVAIVKKFSENPTGKN